MPNIAEFRIVIGDGPEIGVEYDTADGEHETIRKRSLRLQPLHRRTLEFLIELQRAGRLTEMHDYQILGENLFAALFYDEMHSGLNDIGHKLSQAIRDARQVGPDGAERLLRITLNFEEPSVDLCSWPWEYLYSPERAGEGDARFFLAHRTRMALTRYLALENVRRANPAESPLKVLLVAPNRRASGKRSRSCTTRT
jgi:hypothetical protein